MNRLPRRSDALKHQRHAPGNSFRRAFVVLCLRPKTSDNSRISSEHRECDVAHVELHVFDFGIRALAIRAHLLPAFCYGAVVVEEIELRGVPVNAHHLVHAGMPDTVEQLIERSEHAFRSWRLFSRCGRFFLRRRWLFCLCCWWLSALCVRLSWSFGRCR